MVSFRFNITLSHKYHFRSIIMRTMGLVPEKNLHRRIEMVPINAVSSWYRCATAFGPAQVLLTQ